jgi:hypothetical protein
MAGQASPDHPSRAERWRVGLSVLATTTLAVGALGCGGDDDDDEPESSPKDQPGVTYDGLDDIDGSTLVTPFADVALQLYDAAGTSRTDDPDTGIEAASCPLVDDEHAVAIAGAIGVPDPDGAVVGGVSLRGAAESELLTCAVTLAGGQQVELTIGTTLLGRDSVIDDLEARDVAVEEVEGEIPDLDDDDVIGVAGTADQSAAAFWIDSGFQISLRTTPDVADVDGAFGALPALVDAVYTALGRPESPAG